MSDEPDAQRQQRRQLRRQLEARLRVRGAEAEVVLRAAGVQLDLVQ